MATVDVRRRGPDARLPTYLAGAGTEVDAAEHELVICTGILLVHSLLHPMSRWLAALGHYYALRGMDLTEASSLLTQSVFTSIICASRDHDCPLLAYFTMYIFAGRHRK